MVPNTLEESYPAPEGYHPNGVACLLSPCTGVSMLAKERRAGRVPVYSRDLRDKTMTDKLKYNPNVESRNTPSVDYN